MVPNRAFSIRSMACFSIASMLLAGSALAPDVALSQPVSSQPVSSQPVSIVQPGAPGQPARVLTEEEAASLARNSYSPADMAFMQDMIVRHGQAVEMVEDLLALPGTAADPVLFDFTTEVTNDQTTEIGRMNTALVARNTSSPAVFADAETGRLAGLWQGGYWSACWYQGRIHAAEITRGIDVLALEPSEFLTAEEIAAAEAADRGGSFNPQTRFPVTGPNAGSAEVVASSEATRSGG